MNEHTAVVIGASGLIGSHLVEQMLQDGYYDSVRILVRRKLPFSHLKLQQEIVNFDDPDDFKNKFGKGDSIFCCVGTTLKKVKGDIKAYEKIDVDIPATAARIGIEKGFRKYLVISSVGANPNSKNFYLGLKGKMENSLKEFSYDTISIFRPGQLLGERNEYRRGEKILQATTKFMSHLLFGSLKKYHSIAAKDVAKAMIAESKKAERGIHILEYDEMMQLIR